MAPAAPSDVPAVGVVAALAGLPEMGPGRLRALLDHDEPAALWASLTREPARAVHRWGSPLGPEADRLLAVWTVAATAVDPAAVWRRHVDAGVGLALRDHPSYPVAFVDDPAPPPIVFWRGDVDALVGTRVAVVGTRRSTAYGREVAHELGADLSASGVSVVSGLALGIDGAAHRGALAVDGAPPVAVVGCGLDVVYPRRHADLWAAVARRGVVLSEHPLGTEPAAWRFPSRNRLVAALGDALVVVESRRAGGSMHTVREADRRGRPVLAVPGPVRSAASAGTNQLLSEGAAIARDATDVLVRMGLESVAVRSAAEHRRPPSGDGAVVLDALGWQPATFEQLAVRSGLEAEALAVALDDLEGAGWVGTTAGWYERLAKPGG